MADNLERTLNWKQGLAIALGVPLLILPSIGTFATYLWAFAVIAWGLSVLQGFLQNMAYGEMATAFPNASGLPGFAQSVFGGEKNRLGKFIGGFSAWGYWFAWNPVVAIYAILISDYMTGMIPALADIPSLFVSLGVGIVVIGALTLVNLKGASGGATLGYILAFISLIPLFIICLAPFVTGDFHMENITGSFYEFLYVAFYNMDSWMVDYSPTCLYDKKIGSLDSLLADLVSNINKKLFNIVNAKDEELTASTVKTYLNRASQFENWVGRNPAFRANPSFCNDNYAITIGFKRFRSLENIETAGSSAKKGKSMVASLLKANPSHMVVESICALPPSSRFGEHLRAIAG